MPSRSSYRQHSTPFKLQLCQDTLLELIGNIPPAEAEADFYAALETEAMAA